MSKHERHAAILDSIDRHRVASQAELRDLLAARGFEVAQATLSRDIRELRLIKVPDSEGRLRYTRPPEPWEHNPALRRLLPTLFTGIDGAENLLVVKTLAGGAQPVAAAIDGEEWPEVAGTVAGDDTILIILRSRDHARAVARRIRDVAGDEAAAATDADPAGDDDRRDE